MIKTVIEIVDATSVKVVEEGTLRIKVVKETANILRG